LARAEDGRVVFVAGALPGERVVAEVVDQRKDFARARLVEVLEAAPGRVAPPCPHVAEGCGGCQWQHVAPHAQAALKRQLVEDALRRTGGVAEPPVRRTVRRVASAGYRTTVRAATLADGRLGLRRHHSHDVIPLDSCLVAHPRIEELLAEGRFHGCREVTLRAGVATGERLAVCHPRYGRVDVPADVVVAASHHLRGVSFHEEAAGRIWRVSALSFFQSGPEAANVLVDTVATAMGDALDGGGTLVDAYCGVGLLGGALASRRAAVDLVAVESHPAAVADARHNLAGLDARVIAAEVAAWRPPPAPPAAIVADPARTGLGPSAAAALAGAGAPVLVLVSCDPASLGRDTRLLARHGYRPTAVWALDLFPHTAHVEAVARFERG
jgi:23S rRNA (uracil1939-C5)-methyltransferase